MKPLFPLITVGIVVLNREWIIDKMLASLQRQTYPHDRIFVLVVDCESKDNTVQVARQILDKSDFNGHKIIIKKCSIREGRNICIDRTRGDLLFFWDSDVIMGPDALRTVVNVFMDKDADILTADVIFVYNNTIEETNTKINAVLSSQVTVTEKQAVKVAATAMGHTLIHRRVFESVRFDPDLTSLEVFDFSAKARRKGFRIFLSKSVQAFDINLPRQWYSDIHIDMPLRASLRGLRKKAEANVLAWGPELTYATGTSFFLTYKRYLLYLGYVSALVLTVYGLLTNIYLVVVFPFYSVSFLFLQIRKRGIRRGANAILRSVLVGLPYSLSLIYYFAKCTLKRIELTIACCCHKNSTFV